MNALCQFALSLIGILAVAVIASLPIACTMREDQLISNAIKQGVNPMMARCALGTQTNWLCQEVMNRQAGIAPAK